MMCVPSVLHFRYSLHFGDGLCTRYCFHQGLVVSDGSPDFGLRGLLESIEEREDSIHSCSAYSLEIVNPFAEGEDVSEAPVQELPGGFLAIALIRQEMEFGAGVGSVEQNPLGVVVVVCGGVPAPSPHFVAVLPQKVLCVMVLLLVREMLSGCAPMAMAWFQVSMNSNSRERRSLMAKWMRSLMRLQPPKLVSSTVLSAVLFHWLMEQAIMSKGLMRRWEAAEQSRLLQAARMALSVQPYLCTYGSEWVIIFSCSFEYEQPLLTSPPAIFISVNIITGNPISSASKYTADIVFDHS